MKGIAAAAACCVLSTACLGDDDHPPGGPPPAELIGTWRYLPKLSIGEVPIEERQLVTFAPDGHYEIRSQRGVERGWFSVEDHDLTIDPGDDAWVTTSYAATGDRLLVDAMFPIDEVDGSIGVWSGAQSAGAGASTVTLTLGADGSAVREQTGPAASIVDGTWTHVGDDVVFTYHTQSGTPVDRRYQEIVGVAVGEWLYERVTP
jgi:hypothetical protein